MHRSLRAGMTAALLAGGIASLVAVGSTTSVTSPAGDVIVNPGGGLVDRSQFGTLELLTGPDGGLSVQLWLAASNETTTYPLTPQRSDKCRIIPGGDPKQGDRRTLDEFLDIEVVEASIDPITNTPGVDPYGVEPDLGLVENGIGSREQNNCNTSNGRLEPGQGFRITLGSDPMFDDVVFDFGYLDIEGKFGADFFGRTSLGGVEVGVIENGLGLANDNNADNGGTDNDLVRVPQLTAAPTIAALRDELGAPGSADDDFDTLEIIPINQDGTGYYFDRGELALDGGGDFDATDPDKNRTVFNLVTSKTYEYALVCASNSQTDGIYGPNLPIDDFLAGSVQGIRETPFDQDTDWNPVDGPAAPVEADLFRYFGYQHDLDGAGLGVYEVDESGYPVPKPGCDAIGVNLNADAPGVLLEPSDDSAFIRLKLTWHIPASEINDTNDGALDRFIDPENDGGINPDGTLFGYQIAPYCEGFGPHTATLPDGATETPKFDPDYPGVADHVLAGADGGFVPWCVISDTRELVDIDGVPTIVQTQIWDGIGDPRFY